VDLAREQGVSEATIYSWKSKYGGLESEAQRLQQLEGENRQLKHVVADLRLDKEVLKAVISTKRAERAPQRQDGAFAARAFGISERRACGLLGVCQSSCRYRRKPDRNEKRREQLVELAHRRPRFGYRRLGVLLVREDQHINHKRQFGAHCAAGLRLKRHRRRKLVRVGVGAPKRCT
jgi:putative transposase